MKTNRKRKYYVVWQGVNPGIYNDWATCEEQVKGYTGAKYKAFETRAAAEEAYGQGYEAYRAANPSNRMVFERMMPGRGRRCFASGRCGGGRTTWANSWRSYMGWPS